MKLFWILLSVVAFVHCVPLEDQEWKSLNEQHTGEASVSGIQKRSFQTRGMSILNVGAREDGDELLQTSTHSLNFIFTPMPVTLMASYPKPGVRGKRITYIKGMASFVAGNGNIWLSGGGVGQNLAFVTISSPMCGGYFYSVQFYGK